jgi:glycosyltransferase involved in cell wall biosynthesis
MNPSPYLYIRKKRVLKIIILGPAYPLRGGIANFNEALCLELVKQGHDCSLVSFTLQYPGFLFPGTTQLAKEDDAPEGIQITPLLNSVNPITWIQTARYIRKQNPDLVVVRFWLPFMGPCLGSVVRLLRKGSKAQIVAITDNVIPHEKRAFDKSFTKWFVKGCDAFLTMSKSVAKDLQQFGVTGEIRTEPHPVYDIFGSPIGRLNARQSLGLDSELKLVLFFGFIRHYKGLDLLIKAMAHPKLRMLGVKLMVAGEYYEDPKPYKELIQNLGLSDVIILHDHYIPKERVRDYFCAADIIAQPYRSATQSGVTQIAYHFKRAMLVTNVGGLPEIVPNHQAGYVTQPDSEPIAEALVAFFEQNRQAEMEDFVSKHASRFTWESFAKALLELAKK